MQLVENQFLPLNSEAGSYKSRANYYAVAGFAYASECEAATGFHAFIMSDLTAGINQGSQTERGSYIRNENPAYGFAHFVAGYLSISKDLKATHSSPDFASDYKSHLIIYERLQCLKEGKVTNLPIIYRDGVSSGAKNEAYAKALAAAYANQVFASDNPLYTSPDQVFEKAKKQDMFGHANSVIGSYNIDVSQLEAKITGSDIKIIMEGLGKSKVQIVNNIGEASDYVVYDKMPYRVVFGPDVPESKAKTDKSKNPVHFP